MTQRLRKWTGLVLAFISIGQFSQAIDIMRGSATGSLGLAVSLCMAAGLSAYFLVRRRAASIAVAGVSIAPAVDGPKLQQEGLARLQIMYIDAEGSTSTRVIRLLNFNLKTGHIDAWCELREGDRSFRMDRIQHAVDMETGEIIELRAWLKQYASRRPRNR